MDEKIPIIVAMILIAGLEAFALWNGINGTLYSLVIAAIAGLGGFELKEYYNKNKEN